MPKVATLINDLVADDCDSDKSWAPLLSSHLNSINHFGGHYRFTFLSHLLNCKATTTAAPVGQAGLGS